MVAQLCDEDGRKIITIFVEDGPVPRLLIWKNRYFVWGRSQPYDVTDDEAEAKWWGVYEETTPFHVTR